MTETALRDDPVPVESGRHLGLIYLTFARHEIAPAVKAACAAHGCTPSELPMNALPVPRAARERLARLVCMARQIPLSDGREALEVLAPG